MIASLMRYRVLLPLLALLIVGTMAGQIVAEREAQRTRGPSLYSREDQPHGALALALWLGRQSYDVRRVEWSVSVPSNDIQMYFVLAPTRRFTRSEAEQVVAWVSNGGVLIYHPSFVFATDDGGSTTDGLSDLLGLDVNRTSTVPRAGVTLPVLLTDGVEEIEAGATRSLDPRDPAWLPLFVQDRKIVGAVRDLGQGQVIATTATSLFQNETIAHGSNRDIVLGALLRHPGVRVVAFDEYHHGLVQSPDIVSAVRTSPWGWALFYAGVMTFGCIVWGGRRFGPPIIPERQQGRSTADYVTAFAGLVQKARAVGWAQREYARLFRREVSRVLGTRADLSPTEIGNLIETRRRGEASTISRALTILEGRPISERALLDRMRETERALRALRGVEGES